MDAAWTRCELHRCNGVSLLSFLVQVVVRVTKVALTCGCAHPPLVAACDPARRPGHAAGAADRGTLCRGELDDPVQGILRLQAGRVPAVRVRPRSTRSSWWRMYQRPQLHQLRVLPDDPQRHVGDAALERQRRRAQLGQRVHLHDQPDAAGRVRGVVEHQPRRLRAAGDRRRHDRDLRGPLRWRLRLAPDRPQRRGLADGLHPPDRRGPRGDGGAEDQRHPEGGRCRCR